MSQTMRLAMLICSISLMSGGLAAQRSITMRVPLPHGEAVAVVTYDAARFSKDEVSRWMQLSEQGRYAAPVLGSDTECNPSMRQLDVNRLAGDISRARKVIKDLDPNAYPPELSRVVMYLKRLQSFWLWRSEQELAFWQNGSQPELQWDAVDARVKCNNTIEELRKVKGTSACKIVFFDWHNCTNDVALSELGPYPKNEWQYFLHSHDLHVKLISTAGD